MQFSIRHVVLKEERCVGHGVATTGQRDQIEGKALKEFTTLCRGIQEVVAGRMQERNLVEREEGDPQDSHREN